MFLKQESYKLKWLEMIEIRITGKDHDLIEFYLKKLDEQIIEENKQRIKIYYKLNLDTDLSIHLVHKAANAEPEGSALGQNIVSAMKEFGLVNHSIWVQMSKG